MVNKFPQQMIEGLSDTLWKKHAGTGSVGPFTLLVTPANPFALRIVVDGFVKPRDGSAYVITGDQITFSEPVAVDSYWEEEIIQPFAVGAVPLNSVGAAEIYLSEREEIRKKLNVDDNDSILALELSGIKNSRVFLKDGVADAFGDESGIDYGAYNGLDKFTKLLINGDGELLDRSYLRGEITSVGSISFTESPAKFGSSIVFNGSSRIYRPKHSDTDLGSQNFTIDLWFRTTNATPVQELVDTRSSSATADGLLIRINAGLIYMYASSDNTSWNVLLQWGNNFTVAANTWYHLSFVRSGSNVYLFKDGALVQTGTVGSQNINGLGNWNFGGSSSSDGFFTGNMDDINISIGVARRTSNFAVPTIASGVDTGATFNTIYNATSDTFEPHSVGPLPDYSNIGGVGNRTSIITITSTMTAEGGAPSGLIDGAIANNYFWAIQAVVGKYVQFDFGSPKRITEITWIQNTAAGHGRWKVSASTDTINWVDIGTDFILGETSPQQIKISNNSLYRYYRLVGVSGSSSNGPWLHEVQFKISGRIDIKRPIILVSKVTSTLALKNYNRVLVQIDTSDNVLPNVDLTAELSRDNGITWTAANLQLVSIIGNICVYEDNNVNITGQPVGTAMKYRVKTLSTAKTITISGVTHRWYGE